MNLNQTGTGIKATLSDNSAYVYMSFNELHFFCFQIRRSLLNEDEYGFRKAKRPIYYDEGLEVDIESTLLFIFS